MLVVNTDAMRSVQKSRWNNGVPDTFRFATALFFFPFPDMT